MSTKGRVLSWLGGWVLAEAPVRAVEPLGGFVRVALGGSWTDLRPGDKIQALVGPNEVRTWTPIPAPGGAELLVRCVRLSHDRLTRQADGTLFLKFKRGWDDGPTGIVLTPHQLLTRLVAILPQPRRNLTHHHGVFAPGARGRTDIVPRPKVEPGPRLTLLPARAKARRRHHPAWIPWAELLFRVFGADALEGPHCDGQVVGPGAGSTRRTRSNLIRTLLGGIEVDLLTDADSSHGREWRTVDVAIPEDVDPETIAATARSGAVHQHLCLRPRVAR